MQQVIDAEGSERYLFDQDYKPAINATLETIIAMLNTAFAEKKLAPEALREITKIQVWQTNSYSRISYDPAETGFPLWTILAVYPKIVVNKGVSATSQTDKAKSVFRKELSYISSNYSAKRLTFEEWNENRQNIFMPGATNLAGGLSEFAYLDFGDYTSTSYSGAGGIREIEVRPAVPNELVAIAYLKYPTQVNLITDQIEFPESLTQTITEIALSYIAQKQNDGTSLYGTSASSINVLVGLLR
jgi:hypothetical protein